MIICAYVPNDPGTVIYNNAKLVIVLVDMADTLLNVNCDGIILAGDLNCDFTCTTGFVDNVKMFMRNTGLSPLWSKYYVDYTHLHTDGTSTSTIDHFMVSGNILEICENGGVTHSVDNLSNHSIIYAVLQDCSNLNEDDHHDNRCETISSKPAWYKTSACDINTFKFNIDNTLPDMDFYKNNCNHPSCVNEDHRTQIDKKFESLMNILFDSSTNIPQTCPLITL